MKIHNLMEEVVSDAVHKVVQEEKARGKSISEDYITDIVCYVLNRIPPRYVSTGKGIAYSTAEYFSDAQLMVDIVALATEGFKRITSMERSYYEHNRSFFPDSENVFLIPLIKGRVLFGKTFEPAYNVDVVLLHGDRPAHMIDDRWQNPYKVTEGLPGTFVFMPAPFPAADKGIKKAFKFCVKIDKEGFSPIRHFFDVASVSVPRETEIDIEHSIVLSDLYLSEPHDEDTSFF